MSFASQLRHTVTIRRASLGAVDDYGQPARTVSDLATVKALVQPKTIGVGRNPEEPTTYGAGTQVTDHTVFLAYTDVNAADEVLAVSAGIHSGKTFEVLLVKDAGGQGHHLELDCRLIDPDVGS